MQEIYEALAERCRAGRASALATVVDKQGHGPQVVGAKMLVGEEGVIAGSVGGGVVEKRTVERAQEALRSGRPELISVELTEQASGASCGGRMQVFIEPVLPAEELLLFGAGHIGAALAKMAALAGFRVTVIDNRPEFADPGRLPEAARVLAMPYGDSFAQLAASPSTYIVIVTHGHEHDREVLTWAVRTAARYVGMIGSRRKVDRTFEILREAGIAPEKLAQVRAPIGLEIGAEAPGEIAVSILAEMIRVRRQGAGVGRSA